VDGAKDVINQVTLGGGGDRGVGVENVVDVIDGGLNGVGQVGEGATLGCWVGKSINGCGDGLDGAQDVIDKVTFCCSWVDNMVDVVNGGLDGGGKIGKKSTLGGWAKNVGDFSNDSFNGVGS